MKTLRILLVSMALMTCGAALASAQAGGWGWGWGGRDYSYSDAYRDGFRQGKYDAENRCRNYDAGRWRQDYDRRAYDAGYQRGYHDYSRNGESRGGPYGRGEFRNAREFGYQDGLNDGTHDRQSGHSFRPTHDDNFKHADRGYSGIFGSKDEYRQIYRQAYEEGYRQGYNRHYSRW